MQQLTDDFDARLMKVLRRGYSAGPLLEMGYPGTDVKLVASSAKRQHEHESEPYLSEWIEGTFAPGDVFYDVGANVGTYSLIAAAAGPSDCRIVAFEPAFATYAVLCENVFVNGFGDRITTLPVALGETTGLTAFEYSSIRPGAAKHNWPLSEMTYTQPVLAYRLDDLVRQLGLPLPQHVKIDTDGAEPQLLRGAAETLSSPAVKSLMVELLEWTHEDVVGELRRHGFELVENFVRPPSPVTCGLFTRG